MVLNFYPSNLWWLAGPL